MKSVCSSTLDPRRLNISVSSFLNLRHLRNLRITGRTMRIPEIDTIAVIGAGLMGWQIALMCAKAGYNIRSTDASVEVLRRSEQKQQEVLNEWAAAGQLNEPAEAVMSRISRHNSPAEAVAGVQFVIETVTENLKIKRQVLSELDRLCPPSVVLATNSSSIRSSRLADALKYPERLLNFHFLNHPWLRPYVETMTCGQTKQEYLELARRLGKSLGLASVIISGEVQGFIHNRLWRAAKKEAMYLADQGYASIEDIDRAFMIGLRAEKGVFQMMDRAGLDVQLAVEQQWYAESGDESDRPRKILLEKVERGDLGIKTGRGFYTYPNPSYEKPGWLLGSEDDQSDL